MQSESESVGARLASTTADVYEYATGARTRTPAQDAARLPATLFRYRYIKRAMDIVFIILGMPVLLPMLLVVGLTVKFTSPGPIFFRHRRICRNGAFFSMWKFRTMCVNSTEVLERHLADHPRARTEWNRTHKLKFDPRITSVGRFLRRYSLDELPQAWNVLTGQMSLVGPRPIVAAEIEKYRDQFSSYTRVKPGVTGLWQVSGRSKLTYDQRVDLDAKYVKTWSLRQDLWILLQTFLAVANKDGAF